MSFPWALLLCLLLVACATPEPVYHARLVPEQPTLDNPIVVSAAGGIFNVLVMNVWNETSPIRPVIDGCEHLRLHIFSSFQNIMPEETGVWKMVVTAETPAGVNRCNLRLITEEHEVARMPIVLEAVE